ncbi:hypothetical protein CCP3SC1AL1_690013 [Gammaproteobacteria bacterium]
MPNTFTIKNTKKELLSKCKELGISVSPNTSKSILLELLKNTQVDTKFKPSIVYLEDAGANTDANAVVPVKFIYHLADIHIPVIERHEEYRIVIDNFVKVIKNNNCDKESSIIVICGDIFHTRDRLVSETIIMFDYFIESLCSVLPVIMIPGNHDNFHRNNKRLDIIEGILSLKSYANFFYIKDHGVVFNYRNLSFVFNTESIIVKDPPKKEGIVSIALYHGMLNGSVLCNGTSIDVKDGITTGTFKNYDLVLLGDIHKRQFLSSTIAYPGSFIQQNFKEEEEHGYIKWTIDSDAGADVGAGITPSALAPPSGLVQNVSNPYRFMSIKTDLDMFYIPDRYTWAPYTRIRWLIDCSTADSTQGIEEKITALNSSIEKYTKIISISKQFNTESLLNLKLLNDGDIDDNGGGICSSDEQITGWIKDFFLKDSNEKTINTIMDLHTSYSTKLEQSDNVFDRYTTPWEISSIEFKNMYIYGGDHTNIINFEDIPGVVGIFQNNCSGKTSILNTIIYALFGNAGSSKSTSHNKFIMHKNAKDYYTKLTIKTAHCKYIIERIGKPKKRAGGLFSLDETVLFRSIADGVEVNLTDSNKVATTDKIFKILGLTEKDEFLLTNVLSNSIGKSILTMSNKGIEETFTRLFQTEKYKVIYDMCHQDVKLKNDLYNMKIGEKNILQGTIDSIGSIEALSSSIVKLKDTLSKCMEKKQILLNSIEDINIKIELLPKNTLVNKNIEEKYQDVSKEELIKLKDKLSIKTSTGKCTGKGKPYIEIKIKELNDYLTANKNLKTITVPKGITIEKSIEEYEQEILVLLEKKEYFGDSKDLTGDCIKAKRFLQKYKEEFEYQIDLDLLKEDFTSLNEKDGMFIMDKDLRDDTIEALTTVQKQNIQELYYYQGVLKQKEHYDKKMTYNVKLDQDILAIKTKIKYIKAMMYKTKVTELENLEEELHFILIEEEIQQIDEAINNIQNNTELYALRHKRIRLGEERKIIGEEYSSLLKLLTEKQYKETEYINKQYKIDYLVVYLKQIQDDIQNLKIYKGIVSDKQLPKLLIKEIIKKVTREANKIIYSMAGLEVIIEDNLEENGKWDIFIKKNNLVLGTDQISGYERFVVDIGIKIGLDIHKSYSGIKMFFIDEGFDCVSHENLDKVDSLFELLKKNYKTVLAISHNTEMQKKVDNQIHIETDYITSKIIS